MAASEKARKGMKVYVLNTGHIECDKSLIVKDATLPDGKDPHARENWIYVPVMAFLIDTGDGYILYDTGSNPEAMNGYWPETMTSIYPVYIKEEERLENQLALCGVKPEDVKTVVLSHMHLDHAGNLQLFPHADIYVPKADYINGLLAVHKSPSKEAHGAYIKADLENPGNFIPVTDEFELVPGIDVINVPGHTEGLLGLVVHLEHETIIMPQDAIYLMENYGPPVKLSGLFFSAEDSVNTMEKIRALQTKYDAVVWAAHDAELYKTLKLAPEYYD